MTLVDASTGEVLADLTPAAARELTDTIKANAETLWSLLYESHERKAWAALGYESWRTYATTEFGMSQSYAYRLLDQAKVIAEIEQAAGSPMGEISEREARELKLVLAEATAAVKEAVRDAPTEAEKQVRVRAALDGLRVAMVEQKRPKAPAPTPATDLIADYIADGDDVKVAQLRKRFADTLVRACSAQTFDVEQVAPHLDEQGWQIVEHSADLLGKWFDRLIAAKPKKFTVVKGGRG